MGRVKMLVTGQKNHAVKVGIFLLLKRMKTLLLVSATEFEIAPCLQFLAPTKLSEHLYQVNDLQVKVCITGVGMVATAFELGRLNGQHFDYAINAGLAGSFKDLKKGTVVNITDDCFAELGAEDGDQFLSIDELGFGKAEVAPAKPYSNSVIGSLPEVKGITVNKVHGHEHSIEQQLQRFAADVESMEGAAFFHAANAFGWQAAQIRAISNKVERRNRATWEIGLAVKELNHTLLELLTTIAFEAISGK
jgi:futalosine hydrolase